MALAEQQRMEKRADDRHNEQAARENARYKQSLLMTPGVEQLAPTVAHSLPMPDVSVPGVPGLGAVPAMASAAGFGPQAEVPNPALRGKWALDPDDNLYFDPHWQEKKTRLERTALRDAAIVAGAEPKKANLLLAEPGLADNILPKPDELNGWTVMGHEYPTEAAALAAQGRFHPPGETVVGRAKLSKADRRRIANAKIDDMMRTGSQPLSVWDALEADPNTKGALTTDEVADRTRSIEDARAKAAKGDAGDEILALVRKRLREIGAGDKSEAEVPEQRRAITQDQADYLMAAPPQGKGWTQQQVNARYTVKQ